MLRQERVEPQTPPGADAPANPHDLRQGRSLPARIAWAALGLLFVGVGGVGVFVPGLPTTPFLVLAASCFVRSSERLYNWLLANRIFGKPIRDYREGRGVPRYIKLTSIGTMWCFVAFAVLFAIPSHLWIPKGIVLVTAVIGTLYLRSLPSTEDFEEPRP